MATGNPYSRMVNKMRAAGQYYNGYDLKVVPVQSIQPLTVLYDNVIVPVASSSNPVDVEGVHLQEIQQDEQISEGLKQYLMELYTAFYIRSGDKVFVQRVGDAFYIIGKAV